MFSIPYALSGLLAPIFGLLLDMPWLGNPPCGLVATNLLLITAHVLFLSRVSLVLPLVLFGTAFALFGVAFWVTVAECLMSAIPAHQDLPRESDEDDRERGASLRNEAQPTRSSIDGGRERQMADALCNTDYTEDNDLVTLGFGIMTGLLNLSTGVVPLLFAKVEDTEGFDGVELGFLVLAGLGCILCAPLVRLWRK